MAATMALILCLFFILFLLRRDIKRQPHVSAALWIPLFWMLIIGSRFISEWFNIGPTTGPAMRSRIEALEAGSPIDRAVFLALLIAGIIVLLRRKIRWGELFRRNGMIVLFLLYCVVSIAWSDYPFVSLKRWIKMFGNIVMVLLIITDDDPIEAGKALLRRIAWILIPLSVLLIKYFPDLGRYYNPYNWTTAYGGVTMEKNDLGTLCWITGIFCFWSLVSYKKEIIVHVVFLIMIAWLLKMSDSATSQGCFIAGIVFLLLIRNQGVRGYLGTLLLVGFASYLIVLTSTELAPNLLAKMGRDSTLTDRLPIWTAVLEMVKNPLIGTGFESFWLGERLAKLWGMWKGLNNAHNGYLETYLNLGVIGLLLLIGVIGGAYIKCRRELLSNFESGSLRMAFLFLVLLSNVTEATFHGINLVLCIFLIIAIDYFPLEAGEIAEERSPYEVLSSPFLSSGVEREGEFEGEKAIDRVK